MTATTLGPDWLVSSPIVLASVIALTVGGLLIGLIHLFQRPAKEKSLDTLLDNSAKSPAEQRRAPRREGSPVEVVLSGDTLGDETLHGFVLNRSMEGLCLSLGKELAPGSVVRVRPFRASPLVPSTEVEVRHCRPEGRSWIIGCHFVKSPPYSILLLFG